MATVEIRYNGTDITENVVWDRTTFSCMADGQVGQAYVVIDDQEHLYGKTAFVAGKTLELYIDGVREWDGWVTVINRSWPLEFDDTRQPDTVPRFWNLEGNDRNVLFQKRVQFNVADPTNTDGFKEYPAGKSDQVVLRYYLQNYVDLTGDDLDAWSGIKAVGSAGPYEDHRLGYLSAPMSQMFEDCAIMTGAIYYISPGRVIKYNDDRTVTAPFALSDSPGAGEVGYRDLNAMLDFSQAANEAIVLGAGYGSDNPVAAKYTDAASVAAHGTWQWGDLFVGAYKEATVLKRARTYVEGSPNHHRGHNDPVPVVRCTIFEPGLQVADVVEFNATVFGYTENLPVREMRMTFPTPTTVQYELQMTLRIDEPFGAPDPLPELRFPPYDWPDIPGGDPPPDLPYPEWPTGGNLIDHFDYYRDGYGTFGTCGVVLGRATTSSPAGSTHTIYIPDGDKVVGNVVVMFVAYEGANQPTQTSLASDWANVAGESLLGGLGGGTVNFHAYARAIDGTEGWTGTGDTFQIDGNGTGSLWAYTELLSSGGTGLDSAVATVSTINNPPSVTPTWDPYQSARWYTFSYLPTGTLSGSPLPETLWSHADTEYAGAAQWKVNGDIDTSGAKDPSAYSPSTGYAWTAAIRFDCSLVSEGVYSSTQTGSVHVYPLPETTDTGAVYFIFGTRTKNDNTPTPWPVYSDLWEQGWYNVENSNGVFAAFKRASEWSGSSVTVTWDGFGGGNCSADVMTFVLFGVPIDATIEDITISQSQTLPGLKPYMVGGGWDVTSFSVPANVTDDIGSRGVYAGGADNNMTFMRVGGGQSDTNAFAPYDWNWVITYPAYQIWFAIGSDEPVVTPPRLKTPPPARTGAPWAGGNWYHDLYGDLDQTGLQVVDSSLRIFDNSNSDWRIYDGERGLTDFGGYGPVGALTGEIPDYPWSGFSTSYFSDGATPDGPDLLVKWRYNGTDANAALTIMLRLWAIGDTSTHGADVWTTWMYFTVGMTPDSSQDIYMGDPTGGTGTWHPSIGGYPTGAGTFVYPEQAYGGATLQPGTWYWTRVKVGDPLYAWSYPHAGSGDGSNILGTGMNMSYMKTWPYGEAEPTGTSDEFTWYWYYTGGTPPSGIPYGSQTATIGGGWTLALPQAWYSNSDGVSDYYIGEYANELRIYASSVADGTPNSVDYYEVDGVWTYATSLDAGAASASSLDVSSSTYKDYEIRLISGDYTYGGVTYNSDNPNYQVYSTSRSYISGSLRIYHEGILLRPGVDYIELDPEAGTFLLISAVSFGTIQDGTDGSAIEDQTFTSPSASFDASYVGATIIIDGIPYTIESVISPTTVTISGGTISGSGLGWSIPTTSSTFENVDISQGLAAEYKADTTDSSDPVGTDSQTAASVITYTRPFEAVVAHGWATDQDGYNSIFTAAALALARATGNAYTQFSGTPRNTPVTMRSYSGVATGNGTLADVATAWSAGWSQTLTYDSYTWGQFEFMLTGGRGAILLGDYYNLPASQQHGHPSTRATHALYINEQLPDGTYWGIDPLYPYPQTFTASVLQAFAVGYQTSGRVEAGFTEVTDG